MFIGTTYIPSHFALGVFLMRQCRWVVRLRSFMSILITRRPLLELLELRGRRHDFNR